MSNAQEPAFPADKYETWSGLTRLEWFAGQALVPALQGSLTWASNSHEQEVSRAVSLAFEVAEAMCAEAERRRK